MGSAYIVDVDAETFTAVVNWRPVEGAVAYRVQVGQEGDPEVLLEHTAETTFEFTYPKHVVPRQRGPVPVRNLCVFVSAEGPDGERSTSDMATLRMPGRLEDG